MQALRRVDAGRDALRALRDVVPVSGTTILVDGEVLTYERMVELHLDPFAHHLQFDEARDLPPELAQAAIARLNAKHVRHEVRT